MPDALWLSAATAGHAGAAAGPVPGLTPSSWGNAGAQFYLVIPHGL